MKLINWQSKTSWKTVVCVIFCTLFLTACAEANETNAGLCNGNWGMVGGYYCDISSPGGRPVLCVFFGRDNDRDGRYRSGTSDQCIVDEGGFPRAIDCNYMCSLNNNCSNVQCPGREQLEGFDAWLNKQNQSTGEDEIKSS